MGLFSFLAALLTLAGLFSYLNGCFLRHPAGIMFLLARHGHTGIMANHRAMPTPFDTPDQEWLLYQWLPNVVPRRRYTEDVLHYPGHYVKVAVFEELEVAADWLQSGHDPPVIPAPEGPNS